MYHLMRYHKNNSVTGLCPMHEYARNGYSSLWILNYFFTYNFLAFSTMRVNWHSLEWHHYLYLIRHCNRLCKVNRLISSFFISFFFHFLICLLAITNKVMMPHLSQNVYRTEKQKFCWKSWLNLCHCSKLCFWAIKYNLNTSGEETT